MNLYLIKSASALVGPPIVVAFAALLGSAPCATAQNSTWLREFGGPSDDGALALLRIEPGKVVLAGDTYGALFGPSIGPQDAFLAWFDDAGNLLGGVQFGSGAGESAHALAPAPESGVFVAGVTGGSFGAPYAGQGDVWLARRDASGGHVWVRQLGTSSYEAVRAICSDGAGGVFGAGETLGGSLGGPSAGSFDVWIVRYDQAGTLVWLDQFGTSASDYPTGMAADGEGGFYVGGTTSGMLGGPIVGEPDAWIARFDANGKQVWIRQLGTAAWDTGRALSSDGADGAFFAGGTEGWFPGSSSSGGAWLARYDSGGTRTSIMQFGGSLAKAVEAVGPDGLGGAFIAGSTNGSLGGPSAGHADAWVAHVQGGTSVAWIDQFGSSAHDDVTALAAGEPGTVFAAGFTFGNLAPGGGGFDDAWVARYDLCYPDCNADGALTVPDFGCFQTRFITADLYADCNADGVLTVADFGCFQTKFVVGCP